MATWYLSSSPVKVDFALRISFPSCLSSIDHLTHYDHCPFVDHGLMRLNSKEWDCDARSGIFFMTEAQLNESRKHRIYYCDWLEGRERKKDEHPVFRQGFYIRANSLTMAHDT